MAVFSTWWFNAGFVVQLVLLLLLIFSVISWAIILMKYFNIRKIKKENEFFLSSYMKSYETVGDLPRGEAVPEFDAGGGIPGRVYGARETHQDGAGESPGEGCPGSGRPGARNRRHRQCGTGDEQGLRGTDHQNGSGPRVPGNHGKRQPFHRPVRNRLGDHGYLQGDRRPWIGDPRRRGAGDIGGADCDRGGPCRRHPGRYLLQLLL